MSIKFHATRSIAISVMGLALTAGAARAQQPTPAQISAIKSNCRSDYMANCMGVRPGGAEALQCLQRHVAKLSGACKSAVGATLPPPPRPAASALPPPSPAVAAPPAPPKPPAKPKPVVVAPPPAPAAPPPKPAAAATQRPSTRTVDAIKNHCRSDYRAHCMAVTPGGNEALACIQHHYAELSPACKRAVRATMPPTRKGARKVKNATAVAKPSRPAPPLPTIPTAKFESLTIRQKILILRACHYDQAAICPSVQRGGGRIVTCLARHPHSLSPSCRRTLIGLLR